MKQLDDYLELQKQIYAYFCYQENWRVFPIDDRRNFSWRIDGQEVHYWTDDSSEGDGYSDEIYTQRHLPKWVYQGTEYTMIVVDTHVDGNKFLAIYDNSKEITTTLTPRPKESEHD